MSKLFIPDYYCEDVLLVDWQSFAELGLKHVFLDIDNTLELQGAKQAGQRTIQTVSNILQAGMTYSILSNADSSRAQKFCEEFNLPYLGQAAKPLTFRMREYLKKIDFTSAEVILVGDQVFTDLWAARFLGCQVLMVKSMGGKEGFFLRLKRVLEGFLRLIGQNPRKAKPAPVLQRKV